jgi:SAM-dependent methyltransferase
MMNERLSNCPACESGERKIWGEKNKIQIYICKNCKTLYSPISDVNLGDYDEMYSPHNRNSSVSEFSQMRLLEIVSSFDNQRKTNRLLDVGSGAGSLLSAAIQSGWDAEGTEVSKSAANLLRQRNFNVFHGELSEAKLPSDVFDVVTASEVIEHIPVPIEVLREIHRVLRAGGMFWATTPHGRSFSSRFLGVKWCQVEPPVHIHLFSTQGMIGLLKRAGFKNIEVFSQGTNPLEILNSIRNKVDVDNQKNHLTENLNFTDGVELNAAFSKSPARRLLKNTANSILRIAKLGDSMKIIAFK